MSEISILLSPPPATLITKTLNPRRRLSIPTIIKPAARRSSLPTPKRTSPSLTSSLLYALHTLLLFTYSDLKNILIPQTLLALSLTLSASPSLTLATRLPQTLLWVWSHLLLFNLSNQRQPSSLTEDRLNKPWRPLPSDRLSLSSARNLFIATTIACVALSSLVGGVGASVALQGLYILNNDLHLGDTGAVTRNVLNAAGYTAFAIGGISVLDHGEGMGAQGWQYLVLIAAVIVTTGQCQDLEDIEGDMAKGRRTVPIVWGETAGRWSVALPVGVWSVLAPRFWGNVGLGGVLVFALGGVVMKRLMSPPEKGGRYKTTFRLWNCWIVALYLLPMFARR